MVKVKSWEVSDRFWERVHYITEGDLRQLQRDSQLLPGEILPKNWTRH